MRLLIWKKTAKEKTVDVSLAVVITAQLKNKKQQETEKIFQLSLYVHSQQLAHVLLSASPWLFPGSFWSFSYYQTVQLGQLKDSISDSVIPYGSHAWDTIERLTAVRVSTDILAWFQNHEIQNMSCCAGIA